MKFGKVPDISNIDFKLPPDPPTTKAFLSKLPQTTHLPTVYVGCTGWSMKEWLGKVYPNGAKTKDYLKHYGIQFNTIELNTTHYRIPTEDTIKKWIKEVPEDFRYCPKIPQSISHSRELGFGTNRTTSFCEVIQGLGERLGCCFMQLPPYFGYNKMGILKHFLESFPPHTNVPLALEIRHETWFNSQKNFVSFSQLLENFQNPFVITDVAGRRDVLHMGITSPTTMIRFVGNGLHPTDYSRIDAWVERLQSWFEQGLQTAYFFTHEPDNILAPDLALYLVEKLLALKSVKVRGPKFIDEDADKQMSLF